MIKIGLGYDLHALEKGRPLILGGVVIPFDKGEKGHSDGDVLLHAITDALLGAAGLSDIGELFPPSQEQWKGADSSLLLQKAWQLVTDHGWTLDNIDCVIAIEKPKILPFRKEIISRIAEILQCRDDQIFVKAKTGEKLGEIGREEAVCVWAVCLLSKE
ncbi:MAG TPA: 2-C-methyl-D-erythritol 2,4-cyclodiphosphate synthase [Treponemataceae bacterium]|jgi:2-C-methyl-D-erythritol 2,4-cyclodiphosphate synthase|nr:2-C-methyl-D-erythritol 2,4-cyclodiphosphate synthase [Treponemataceae bacterium]